MEQLQIHSVSISHKNIRKLNVMHQEYTYPIGLFDGASMNNIGGIGIYLMIINDYFYCVRMGCDHSTNTCAELLALWVLLTFANMLGLPYLHIRGDSSAIINWFNRRVDLSSLELEGWCRNIRALQDSFAHLEATHVYREYNDKADSLSKEALGLNSGYLHYMEFIEGKCSGRDSFQFY